MAPVPARTVPLRDDPFGKGMHVPDRQKPRAPDLVGVIGLALIVALLAGAYFGFPWLLRVISYQDCIASGRITGC